MTAEITVVGISRLDDHVLLADAGLAMAMVQAGARRLVDLRGETKPPGLLSRTSTVAIAYLMVRGMPLDVANRTLRRARPQAMPAIELWRSLERLAPGLAG